MGVPLWKIVLIEDHDPDVFLIKEALAAHSIPYDLKHFRDSEEAVRWLCLAESFDQAAFPDLILLDLNMPRISGIEVLKRIRETPRLKGVPVAILTSSYSPLDRRQAEAAGATVYVSKPAMLDEFLDQVGTSVSNLLRGRHHQAHSD
ncbi:MAG: response regulator [Bryobacteraceae bacterium]